MKYILLFVFVSLLTGCHSTKKEKEGCLYVSVLRGPSAIALASWMENPPVINGKKVVLDIVDSPLQMQAAILKETTDMAVLPMITAANLHTKGVNYLLAGCPVWGTLYLVGKPDARQVHLFGAGTTPDILTRYYLDTKEKKYTLNYTLNTASEVAQGLLSGRVEAAVLSEPFVSLVLNRDKTIQLLADLNHPDVSSPGFPQTAILLHPALQPAREQIDSLLQGCCQYTQEYPTEVIHLLQSRQVFPQGILSAATIERCKIHYKPVYEAEKEIRSFLQLIYTYALQAVGGELPDHTFYSVAE